MTQACWAELGPEASFSDFEVRLYERANEMVRSQIERRLRQIEEAHTEQVRIDSQLYRRHEPGEVEYHTLCGKVKVHRWTYREVGVRNGPTVVPLELSAGLIHRATPALAYSIALGYASAPMRHYEEQMKAAYRAPPPRATLERMARKLGGCAAQDVVQIEAQIRRNERVPAEAHAIAVSLDRTTVAMAEERSPGVAANSRRKPRKKPYQRRPPHPFDVNWRMPYVGTVSLIDRDGETITSRKYHATPEEGTAELMTRMMADVTHCRTASDLAVVVVQDGAPEMWNEIRTALRRAGVGKWTEVLDRFHLNERLSAALELTERDDVERRRRFEDWQQQLNRSDGAIRRISKWLEARWYQMPRTNQNWSALGGHVNYIHGYAPKMKYASLRRAGLPIASGAVEGACKSLVACRAKRSGQRWKQDGLTAALTLRSLELSDRLSPFWNILSKRFIAHIHAA